MPLLKSGSKKAIATNIREFHTGPTYAHTAEKFGKKRADAQAVAAAMNTARRYGRADGGDAGGSFWVPRPPRLPLPIHSAGMIHSAVPGRTDKLPMNVKGGSYIIPADVVSGIGQGNSVAGATSLDKLFKIGPYGTQLPKISAGMTPHLRMPPMSGHGMRGPLNQTYGNHMGLAAGGTSGHGDLVPIIAAGGEYAVPVDVVERLGGGDVKEGHRILDALVLQIRKKTINDMKNLKPPKKR